MKIIDEIISAHGDPSIWNNYNRIITTISFGGLAFWMKFNIRGYIKRRYIISLENPMVLIENFPGSGMQGIFTPDEVWIES
jgi:hypothetical protein